MQPYPIQRGGNSAYAPYGAMLSHQNSMQAPSPVLSAAPAYAVGNRPSSALPLTYAQQMLLSQASAAQVSNGPTPALAGRGTLPPGQLTAAQAAYLNQNQAFGRAPSPVQPYPIVVVSSPVQRVQPGANLTPQRELPGRSWPS